MLERTSGVPEPVSVALADNMRCLAVAVGGLVEVLDLRGQRVWQWDYRQTLEPGGEAGWVVSTRSLAVSPSCDAVAIIGDAGNQTWLATRSGKPLSIRTPDAPLAVAFDRAGALVAIGTTGKELFLYSAAGELKWRQTLEGWCCELRQVSFSDDNRSIVITGQGIGVLRADGTPVWSSSHHGMNAARDLRTFVAWSGPSGDSNASSVSVLDESGKALWTRVASPDGIISPSGDTIVAWIDDDQRSVRLQPDTTETTEQKGSLQVLARNGDVISTLPFESAERIAFSPDGNRIVIATEEGLEVVDLRGNVLLRIPIYRSNSTRMMVAPDFSGVLVASADQELQLKWFRLDEDSR